MPSKKSNNVASGEPNTRIEDVGPEKAHDFLERGGDFNRQYSERHAARLATKMRNGTWLFNGDSLKFNGEKLLDGQHRLNAIVMSGMTFPFVIVTGIAPVAFRTYDSGKRRNFADALGIDREKYHKDLAQAVRWTMGPNIGFDGGFADIEDQYSCLTQCPELRELVERHVVFASSFSRGITTGLLAAFELHSNVIDADLAPRFAKALATGEADEFPAVALARDCIEEMRESKTKVSKPKLRTYMFLVQAWNATRTSKVPTSLKSEIVSIALK